MGGPCKVRHRLPGRTIPAWVPHDELSRKAAARFFDDLHQERGPLSWELTTAPDGARTFELHECDHCDLECWGGKVYNGAWRQMVAHWREWPSHLPDGHRMRLLAVIKEERARQAAADKARADLERDNALREAERFFVCPTCDEHVRRTKKDKIAHQRLPDHKALHVCGTCPFATTLVHELTLHLQTDH